MPDAIVVFTAYGADDSPASIDGMPVLTWPFFVCPSCGAALCPGSVGRKCSRDDLAS